MQDGYKQQIGVFIDLYNDDFLDVLLKGDKKVGIVTQGDYAIGIYSVRNHLAKLDSLGCDQTICACTLGPSKQKIKAAIAQYKNITVSKIGCSDRSLHRIENNQDANSIIKAL